MVIGLSVGVLSACGEKPVEEYTVTFYSGAEATEANVIKSVKVVDGKLVEKFTPIKEGFTFINWYSTPLMNREFIFSTPIKKDTAVFANWKSAVYKADTREWQIAGTSAVNGVLSQSNWGKPSEANKPKFVLTKLKDDENKFSITLDLYPGDSFQIADIKGADWGAKRGYGYIKDPTDSIKKEGTGYGETDSLGANITLLKDGNYTITLTTEVDNSTLDEIVLTRNSNPTEVKTLVVKPSMYGTITGGNALNKDFGDFELKQVGDTNVYSTTLNLNKDDYFSILPTVGGYTYQMRGDTLDKATVDAKLTNVEDKKNVRMMGSGNYTISVKLVMSADKYTFTETLMTIVKNGEIQKDPGVNTYKFVFGGDVKDDYEAYVRKGARVPMAFKDPEIKDQKFVGWYTDAANNIPQGLAMIVETENQIVTLTPRFLTATTPDTRNIFLSGIGGWKQGNGAYKMKRDAYHTYTLTVTTAAVNNEFVFTFFEGLYTEIVYEKDANGENVLDKDGNPIVKFAVGDGIHNTGVTANGTSVKEEAFKSEGNIKLSEIGTYLITFDTFTMESSIVKQ